MSLLKFALIGLLAHALRELGRIFVSIMVRLQDSDCELGIKYRIITGKDCPELLDISDEVVVSSWPEFMLKNPVANEYWADLYQTFPEFQFAMLEISTNNVIAVGNSIPLAWDGNYGDLPDNGWEWALARGFKDCAVSRAPNIQCALSLTIPQNYRGRGISAQALQAMKTIGKAYGFDAMMAPVRPNLKSRYPLTTMEQYTRWQNDDGLPFDPWIRVHVRLGAGIVKVCTRSMRIIGTVEDWERWTGMRFPESGMYIVPGALVPVEIDYGANQGIYVEPNVWMRHSLR
ncbi:MAG: GNAT family N-acetyltransferase [Candidatus Poribacteria bacterium]